MISSLNNATVKATAKLRKRRERERRGAFLVEGHRAVTAALEARAPVTALLHLPRARSRVALLDAAGASGAKVVEVTEQVMQHLTEHAHPPDVLAVTIRRPATVEAALAGELTVVLSAVHDPAVAGGVLAVAAAAGATGAVSLRSTADLFAPACVRAAAGAHFAMPVAENADAAGVSGALGARAVFRLEAQGVPVCSAGMRTPMALVVHGDDDSAPIAGTAVCAAAGALGVSAGLVARAAIALHDATAHPGGGA